MKILVCPLDWGLGHATRCVPVIRHLLKENHEIIIAADGRPYDFLREYFPGLRFIRMPGFRVVYPSGRNMALKMAVQAPSMLAGICREHRMLAGIISDTGADVVISDNRFGLWSRKAYSIYITHQLMIKAPENLRWAGPWLHRFHRWFISHYNECWVPDLPGEMNLSGDLGHKYPLPQNGRFAGILSRFEGQAETTRDDGETEAPAVLVMLSGPEPQRSVLEKIILEELSFHPGLDAVILQGIPGGSTLQAPYPQVKVYNHLPDREISRLIRNAGVIICRPGYSTLMDLCTLGRNAVLVPTPGQTEQEYLAGYLSAGGSFAAMKQEGFSLGKALEAGRESGSSCRFHNEGALLEERIGDLNRSFSFWNSTF